MNETEENESNRVSIKRSSTRKREENAAFNDQEIRALKPIESEKSGNSRRISEFFGQDKSLKSHLKESLELNRNTYVDKVLNKRCRDCNSMRPPMAYHCPVCKRCVAYMDHHCPWINNCVGLYTQKPFILFLAYSQLCLIYSFALNLTHGYQDLFYNAEKQSLSIVFDGLMFLRCLVLLEHVTLLTFLIVVFYDQICIITNRVSTIEKIRLHVQPTNAPATKLKRRA